MKNQFLADLQWRGLIADCTDLAGLSTRMDQGPVSVYCGFDPTAQSLHVGSLIPLLGLARFQQVGHRALALVGGATGLIGDPSGKSVERNLQTEAEVYVRAQLINAQLAKFVDIGDDSRGKVVDNLSWTQSITMLEFMRDVGKHFSVNAMISRDSIKSRLEREGEGISFTEFSYMLLQANDFLKLHELEGCSVQIGGSDQWGNMCSGADLIRRKHGAAAFALTFPLLTTSDGQKFGKTVKGAVWLDKELTSIWDFYQFWLNTDDKDVVRFLKMFTFIGREEIEALAQSTLNEPHARLAQRRLAAAMTVLVHGEPATDECLDTAAVLFRQADPKTLSTTSVESLASSLPVVELPTIELPTLARLLVLAGLETSTTRAAEAIRSGAVAVNGEKCFNPLEQLQVMDALHGRWYLIRKGKKSFALAALPESFAEAFAVEVLGGVDAAETSARSVDA